MRFVTRSRVLVFASLLFASLLAPTTAFAQEEPPPPEVFEPAWTPPPPPPPPRKNLSGVVLGIDVGAAYSFGSPNGNLGGFGADFRVGYRFAVGPIWIAPQVDLGWVSLPAFDSAVRLGLGGQIGVDAGIFEPSIYAFGGGFWNFLKSGPGMRTGVALDFRIRRSFVLGFHTDYDAASWDTGSVRYISPGAHVGWVIR